MAGGVCCHRGVASLDSEGGAGLEVVVEKGRRGDGLEADRSARAQEAQM